MARGERMNKKECDLAAKMLNQLSDILGNRCCNDFNFPDNWDYDDKYKFVKAYHNYNGDPEEFDGENLRLSDFCAAGLLADKLSKMFEV